MKTWVLPVDGSMYRVVLEKDTLDIYVNGQRADTAGEFTDEGTETHFTIANTPAFVRAESTGNRRKGIAQKLFVHDSEVPEYLEHFLEDAKWRWSMEKRKTLRKRDAVLLCWSANNYNQKK